MTQQGEISVFARACRCRQRPSVALVSLVLMAIGLAYGIVATGGPACAEAAPPATSTPKVAGPVAPMAAGQAAAQKKLKVVARINGEDITRNELAQECLRHYGSDVLERLVNKYLIVQQCTARGVTVSQEEVNAEVRRMATRFGLPIDQWLKMLKEERGISPAQYANDIIWPTLALRKLAGDRLAITEEELQAEYETLYGPAVKARLIVCGSLAKAQQVRAQAVAAPEKFGDLAKLHSEDVNSASAKGLINPIRKHVGSDAIEKVAFGLAEGEISQPIRVGDQYAIVKCEGHLPARKIPFDRVRPALEEMVRDAKMRRVAGEIFQELQQGSKMLNVFNDPELSRRMPGVAAVINGNQVSLGELAELCLERHGEEVLQGTINRRLLEQECRRRKIEISEADLDAEISRAAGAMLEPREDGTPDVEKWLKMVTKEQGISVALYRHDSVWPTVALKKLAGDSVEVSEEDLHRGFEANYGERVRCRAIVLNNQRRAQQVWEKARQNPTVEYFGDLAEQYSIEPGSRALRGEVPPIQRYGGQPILEKEAFSLKPNELSSIVQVGNRYVILFCESRTQPMPVEFEEVRDYIYQDIREKKTRIAMAQFFEHLKDQAAIDNFLAGTTHSPKRKASVQTAARPGAAPKR